MITTCTNCQVRYRLAGEKVPWRKVRVRCPSCRSVFVMDGADRETTPATLPATDVLAAVESVTGLEGFSLPSAPPAPPAPRQSLPPPAPSAAPAPPVAAAPVAPSLTAPVSPAPPPAARPAAQVESAVAVAVADPAPRTPRRIRRDKTEMLARALVSDILVYNRDARDRALADGNLLEVLGPEIKKSWELYKEKVGASTASATTYFKDALNEILADGRKVF